jgi:hypothetical protein
VAEPSDIPAERPAALSSVEALVGEWEMEASFEAGFFGPAAQRSLIAVAAQHSNGSRATSS